MFLISWGQRLQLVNEGRARSRRVIPVCVRARACANAKRDAAPHRDSIVVKNDGRVFKIMSECIERNFLLEIAGKTLGHKGIEKNKGIGNDGDCNF